MFALSDADLQLRILGCADGPASFNAESTRRGAAVISIDPLYRLETGTIRDRIAETYDQILEQAQRNRQQFVWDTIQSVEELGRIRMQTMQVFLDDYDLGKPQGRYVDAELPSLVSQTNHLTWRFARISSFCTQSNCLWRSTSPQFSNCAVLPVRLGFFRYSP
jgi:hypothetical protein